MAPGPAPTVSDSRIDETSAAAYLSVGLRVKRVSQGGGILAQTPVQNGGTADKYRIWTCFSTGGRGGGVIRSGEAGVHGGGPGEAGAHVAPELPPSARGHLLGAPRTLNNVFVVHPPPTLLRPQDYITCPPY